MQYDSACRKRSSPIQRFSSTRIRCITAIWPAGPPKLFSATRIQTRSASEKGTPCSAFDKARSAHLGDHVVREPPQPVALVGERAVRAAVEQPRRRQGMGDADVLGAA